MVGADGKPAEPPVLAAAPQCHVHGLSRDYCCDSSPGPFIYAPIVGVDVEKGEEDEDGPCHHRRVAQVGSHLDPEQLFGAEKQDTHEHTRHETRTNTRRGGGEGVARWMHSLPRCCVSISGKRITHA